VVPNEPVKCGDPLAPQLIATKPCIPLTTMEDYLQCLVANTGILANDLNEMNGYTEKLEDAVRCYKSSNTK
jgi:hypothetical protein